MEIIQKIGKPFEGGERKRLCAFLKGQGLDYEEGITYSVLLEAEGAVAATGSCQGNVLKCIAVAEKYRGQNLLAPILTELVTHLAEQGITHYFGFTKPENRQIFCSMGLYPVAETDKVLLLENRRNGLSNYIKKLQKETETAAGGRTGTRIGAVVANCNPFTLGHRYLIETAAKQCDVLHVFLLSEEQEFLSTRERLELVKLGTSDIPGVVLHSASDYLISPAVFPTYFLKEKASAYEVNCGLDIRIFGERIAPGLGITVRFMGTEPFCRVTAQYNRCLKEQLPDYHIQVVEVPRIESGGRVISASAVRAAWKTDHLEEVADMLPETTFSYLTSRSGGPAREVTLEEMMWAREQRARRQKKLLSQGSGSLICFTLNIPGPVKTSARYRAVFEEGIRRIKKKLREDCIYVEQEDVRYEMTGYEYYAVVRQTAEKVKSAMILLEEEDRLGRLFDLDVLDEGGLPVGRERLGAPARKCLLCQKEAHDCARSRNHSLEALLETVNRLALTQMVVDSVKRALLEEVHTTPKPGLVDRYDCGAHKDMNMETFERSTEAITPFLGQMFYQGLLWEGEPDGLFHTIRKIGQDGEAAMLKATNGVNTHKGALFTMGILCASAGHCCRMTGQFLTDKILDYSKEMTEETIRSEFETMENRSPRTNGERLYCQYHIEGIRGEARRGFPILRETALPAGYDCRKKGKSGDAANIYVLLHIMTKLEDTNVIVRSSREELQWLKQQAAAILRNGDAHIRQEVAELNQKCIEKNISPGGAADILSAALFLMYLEKSQI